MTEPTVASAVLQDDGRYLVTLSNGKTYYGPVGAGAPLTVSVTIPPVTLDPTGLATDARQDTGNAALASVVTNTTGLAKESGGNLAAIAAAIAAVLPPVSASGTLTSATPEVVLALGGRAGASFYFPTSVDVSLGLALNAWISFDDGVIYDNTAPFFSMGGYATWTWQLDQTNLQMETSYDCYIPTGVTHLKLKAALIDDSIALPVILSAQAQSAAPPLYLGNINQPVPPLSAVIAGMDGNTITRTLRADPDGTLHTKTNVGAANHAASTVTIASGAGTVAARPTRTTAILYCPASNAAEVLLEGVMPIPKGVWTSVAATDAIAVTGTNGDVVQVVEVYN